MEEKNASLAPWEANPIPSATTSTGALDNAQIETAPWEETPEKLPIKNENHPDISFSTRFWGLNTATNTENLINWIKKQHPNLKVRTDDEGDIIVKRPSELYWKRFDRHSKLYSLIKDAGKAVTKTASLISPTAIEQWFTETLAGKETLKQIKDKNPEKFKELAKDLYGTDDPEEAYRQMITPGPFRNDIKKYNPVSLVSGALSAAYDIVKDPEDFTDIIADIGTGTAAAIAGTAGAALGIPSPVPGSSLALGTTFSSAAGAEAEMLRQKLGKKMGVNSYVDPKTALGVGAMSGLNTLVFGTGLPVKKVPYKFPKRWETYKAKIKSGAPISPERSIPERVTEKIAQKKFPTEPPTEAAEKAYTSQAGVINKAVTKGGELYRGAMGFMTKVPADAAKKYLRLKAEVDLLNKAGSKGVASLTKDGRQIIFDAFGEAKKVLGKQLDEVYEKIPPIPTEEFFNVFDNEVRRLIGLTKMKGGKVLEKKYMEEISKLENMRNSLFGYSVDNIEGEARPTLLKAIDDIFEENSLRSEYQKGFKPMAYTSGGVSDLNETLFPKKLDPRVLFEMKQNLKELAKYGGQPLPNSGVNFRQVSQMEAAMARKLIKKINKVLQRNDKSGALKQLNEQYIDQLELGDLIASKMTDLGKTYTTLTQLGDPKYLRLHQKIGEMLGDDALKVFLHKVDLLRANDIFGEPVSLPLGAVITKDAILRNITAGFGAQKITGGVLIGANPVVKAIGETAAFTVGASVGRRGVQRQIYNITKGIGDFVNMSKNVMTLGNKVPAPLSSQSVYRMMLSPSKNTYTEGE